MESNISGNTPWALETTSQNILAKVNEVINILTGVKTNTDKIPDIKTQTDTLPALHNTANGIKAQTDKIGFMQTTLNTVKSSTDNISAIKSQTDNISAIKSKVDSINNGNSTGIIEQDINGTTICNLGGTLSLQDQITWANKVCTLTKNVPLNNGATNDVYYYVLNNGNSRPRVYIYKNCLVHVYINITATEGYPYVVLGDTIVKAYCHDFYLLRCGRTIYVWSNQNNYDSLTFIGSSTVLGYANPSILFHMYGGSTIVAEGYEY